MIYIFHGADRVKADGEAKKILGQNYEVIDAENLQPTDLPSIFLGTTFFESERKILIKDLGKNKTCFAEIEKYLETPHTIVLLEFTLDGRSAIAKSLAKNKLVKIQEFKEVEKIDRFLAFAIYDIASRNGQAAIKKLREVEETEEPQLMLGAWASSAAKNFSLRPSPKNKAILQELAKIDLLMKTSTYSDNPWTIMESFLLRMKDL